MPRDDRSFLRFSLPLAAWLAVMLTLNSLPGDRIPLLPIPHFDKLVHAAEYGLLTVLLFRFFCFVKHLRFRTAWLLALGGAMVYGVLDELHQTWIPGRSCSLADYLADLGGMLAGVLALTLLYRPRRIA